jgi:hypothetical protein
MALNAGSAMPDLIWTYRDIGGGYIEMTPDYAATLRRREAINHDR